MEYTLHTPHNRKNKNFEQFTNLTKAKKAARCLANKGDTAIIHFTNNVGCRSGQLSYFTNSKGKVVCVEGA